MLHNALKAFGITAAVSDVTSFGSGLINRTWKINNGSSAYILQKINDQVFKQPASIAYNINITAAYLKKYYPNYLFVTPVKSVQGEDFFIDQDASYYRLSPFVANSHTIDVVATPSQAYEAALQFGQFTKLLSGLDVSGLKTTLPNFHDLSLRYQQFEQALTAGNATRIKQAAELIAFIVANKNIVSVYEEITTSPDFTLRATHHDTKISNVLFDDDDRGLCVIDLDTLMPGYFISDVGDMLRTYLSPVSEEEKDFSKIAIREDYFLAIAKGYLSQLGDELSDAEKNKFVYAGKFMIYMQAIRFLTDYLNNDQYYGAKYEEQNFVRAGNQIILLHQLMKKENELQAQVKWLDIPKQPALRG